MASKRGAIISKSDGERVYVMAGSVGCTREKEMTILTDLLEEEQFISGEYVAPGAYCESGKAVTIHFERANYLPVSAEGTMCTYVRAEDLETVWRRASLFAGDTWNPTAA